MAEQAPNLRAPLWRHVTILEKQIGGGNTKWKCNFCDHVATSSFIHSVSRNALTPERAQDLVFTHSNLRLLSRRSDSYKKGESIMWDVGGDAYESLTGVGLLEVANLSIDEPELQAISFGDVDAGLINLEDDE